MPTRDRAKFTKRQGLSNTVWDFLTGKLRLHDIQPIDEDRYWTVLLLGHDYEGRASKLWAEHQDTILIEHVKESPGTRPALWWEYSAPRSPIGTHPGCWYDGELPEPRKQIGGSGRVHGGFKPTFQFGLPDIWTDIDIDDPPIFESQAAYLKRRGLLFAGEEKRSDFDPVTIPWECDWSLRIRREREAKAA